MARLPARVGWITHDRTGTKVALRLDKQSMTFQARWTGTTYKDQDGAVLRGRILELIEASEHLVFHPVIKVRIIRSTYNEHSESIDVKISRFYYANSDSELLSTPWENKGDEHQVRRWNPGENFTGLPHRGSRRYTYGADYYYLAYSEDLWVGLTALLDTIKRARANIVQLLNADNAALTLEAVGAEFIKALPAPKGEESSVD